jgi:hypothetical protein
MRSELGKECRKLFRKMMATELSEYREDRGQIVPQGRYVWTRQHASGIWFHILHVNHSTRDEFTLEAAWDLDGKLPGPAYGKSVEIFVRPLLFRVNWLWSGKDYWWPLMLRPKELETAILYEKDPVEQCLPLVAPAVADAAQKLKEHLVPVFEKVLQKHGIRAGQAGDATKN